MGIGWDKIMGKEVSKRKEGVKGKVMNFDGGMVVRK